MHRFFKTDFFNFEFIRILSTAQYGGCETGEALKAASLIKDADPETWSEAWFTQAKHAEGLAEEAARSGDVPSARAAYLRAANYFRASQFMLNNRPPREDERVIPRLEKSRELFRKGVELLDDAKAYPLSIPIDDGVEIPGYLYVPVTPAKEDGGHPLLINLTGGDSTQEEMFVVTAAAGPARGYAVLTFDGPGQGILLKKNKLAMKPNYEVITSQVIDYISRTESDPKTSHGIDLDRIAVVGASMGAYFALRSAVDARIKACISLDPPYDMWDLAVSRMPGWFIGGWSSGWISDGAFNNLVSVLSKFNFQFKWEIQHMQWMFGADSPADAMRGLKTFTLKSPGGGEHVSNIKCPVLVSGAAGSMYFDPKLNSQKIYDALGHLPDEKKRHWLSDQVEDGGLQAKVGAFWVSNYRMFAWCDQHLGVKRNPFL
ncbi:alpha/beta-hydrolase [Massarina eburnea CBS 473.64]|uniref:Alpha/beta-hydrolase n=1 Tax=Massarina eburnea CBS 473.64 TaxID=1395130 RepID=A0A6A6S4M3_9PLEO|nr:alpha/beta-hydrolase [Massarina eburnea CBS 473.64]